MASGHAVASYLALTPEQQRDVAVVQPFLTHLMNSLLPGQPELGPEQRRRLLACLLASLSSSLPTPIGATATATANVTPDLVKRSQVISITSPRSVLTPLIGSIKALGRSPAGSEELARESGLKSLVAYGGLAKASKIPPYQPHGLKSTVVESEHSEDEEEDEEEEEEELDDLPPIESDLLCPTESEALRCLCNTLTLHPSARDLFPVVISQDPDSLVGLLRLLEVEGAGFLAGRLLFLLTSKQSEVIRELAEGTRLVTALRHFAIDYLKVLRSDMASVLDSGGAPTTSDILREHLKVAYNVLLQYGRRPTSIAALAAMPNSLSTSDSEVENVSPPARPDTTRNTSSTSSLSPVSESQSSAAMATNEKLLPVPPQRPLVRRGSSEVSGISTPDESGENSDVAEKGGESEVVAKPARRKSSFWSTGKQTFARSSSSGANNSGGLGSRLRYSITGSSANAPTATLNPSIPPAAPSSAQDSSTTTRTRDSKPDDMQGELSVQAVKYFLPLFRPYLRLACLLPLGDDPGDPSPMLRGAFNSLLNFPVTLEEMDGYEFSWLQPVRGAEVAYPSLPPLPSRLLQVFRRVCDARFPTNVPCTAKGSRGKTPAHPDDLIPKGMGESSKAEEILGPIMLLLRKLSLLNGPSAAMKEILLPNDIERTDPLERRTDLIGHLVRLLSSVLLPNTAYGVGEFLYNLCDRDPATLCTQIGYGNASGYLQSRGELIAPPPVESKPKRGLLRRMTSSSSIQSTSSTTRPLSRDFDKARKEKSSGGSSPIETLHVINPITGAFEPPPDPNEVEMTGEEKQRESEKLYVLFERMHRTGVMDVENPIKKAAGQGRFQETSDEAEAERQRLEDEDAENERSVEKEMAKFRATKRMEPKSARIR